MRRFTFEPLGNGRWEISYADVLAIRKATEVGAAPRPVECFILGRPSENQRQTIAALIRIRPDGGSHYESAMTHGYNLRVTCDGGCEANNMNLPLLYFCRTRGWYTGAVRQDFDTLDSLVEWWLAHRPIEEPIQRRR